MPSPAELANSNLPPFTAIQGANSSTFDVPPLDGSVLFQDLLAYHATHSPKHTYLAYADHDAGDVKTINYETAYYAQLKAARFFKTNYQSVAKHNSTEKPVISILASLGMSL
jgi:hypothetical protein